MSGIRVVDLTRFVSGAYATMLLASLGAEVLKLEPPPRGDPYRGTGGAADVAGESALFLALNAGKRSIALDFRSGEVLDLLDQLLATSHVLVENGRPGSLERYGLDADSVLARHPHLIYASVSGFGQEGPDAERGGFDLILQAESGVMSVTGDPTSGPVKVGAPVLDVGAGLSCVVGILAARSEQVRTGLGTRVSSSLLEFALSGLTTLLAEHAATGETPGLLGSHSPMFAPYGLFRTSDGFVALSGTGSGSLWGRLCEVLDRPELETDPRFATNSARVEHREALTDEIEATLSTAPTSHWQRCFDAAGIPAGELRDLDGVTSWPQVAALGSLAGFTRDDEVYRVIAPPMRLGADALLPGAGAPELGADTRAVLDELGVEAGRIDELVERGVALCG